MTPEYESVYDDEVAPIGVHRHMKPRMYEVPFTPGMKLEPGMKLYRSNRGKSLLLAVIGKQSMELGCNVAAAHVDAPRLDLKQLPLYEDGEMAYFKTH